DNFNQSPELSIHNLEKLVSVYNSHLNMALNFNKNFAETINSQIAAMFELQKKNLDTFFATNLLTEWWKNWTE
ncbi:MAG: hypothetical protein HKL88_00920, partial [Bacteroidia bacterium]|nr:hypothetical protein [Bacteroidia bacterium]